MKLGIITAHAGADSLPEATRSWGDQPLLVVDGRAGMLAAYQDGYRRAEHAILAYLHDDFLLRDPPDEVWPRVLDQFTDPGVGLVGFGGALIHGSPDLYKTPFRVAQLGRALYRSNVDDAEVHGERFTGVCDAAVLDGFALVVRRSILDRVGGWPVGTPVDYVGYDYWLACETHRAGYRIRLVGSRCHHLGGRTAVRLKRVPEDGSGHFEAHRWLYDRYRDVLPWSVTGRERLGG